MANRKTIQERYPFTAWSSLLISGLLWYLALPFLDKLDVSGGVRFIVGGVITGLYMLVVLLIRQWIDMKLNPEKFRISQARDLTTR